MTFESFKSVINTYKQLKKRCDEFDKTLEDALNLPLREGNYPSDSTSYLVFPMEALEEVITEILVDEGETRPGAEWFFCDGLEAMETRGTEIDDIKISSLEDYYNYLHSLGDHNGK